MSSRREISDLLIPWRNSFADFGGFNRRRGGSTETRTALPGVVQSGTNAFTEDVAFELQRLPAYRPSLGQWMWSDQALRLSTQSQR